MLGLAKKFFRRVWYLEKRNMLLKATFKGLCNMTVDLLVWFCGTNELSLNQKSLLL